MWLSTAYNKLVLAGALAIAPMLAGCGQTLLPRVQHVNAVFGNNCVIQKGASFEKGIILSILVPLVPDIAGSDTTNIDDNCRDRQVAQALIQKEDTESRTIARTIYDQLSPQEKLIFNRQYQARGTSIEELTADLPTITGTTVDKKKKCVTIQYRLPEENTTPFIIKCANGPRIS